MKLKNIIPESLKPYKGIIYFVIILFASHYLWRFTVKGDEGDIMVTFLGMNITAPFDFMAKHFAEAVAAVLHFFGSDVILAKENVLYYENGHAIRIVWSCTAIKQAYMFVCIIAFTHGPWKKKLWYIPLGIIAIYLMNLFRLTVITGSAENHFEWFHFLHEYLFKYLFYGFIFLLWIIWDEKIVQKEQKKKAAVEEKI